MRSSTIVNFFSKLSTSEEQKINYSLCGPLYEAMQISLEPLNAGILRFVFCLLRKLDMRFEQV